MTVIRVLSGYGNPCNAELTEGRMPRRCDDCQRVVAKGEPSYTVKAFNAYYLCPDCAEAARLVDEGEPR